MSRAHFTAALLAGLLVAGAQGGAHAHDEAHPHRAAAAPAPGAAKVVLREEPLVDAAGKRVRLAKDVIGDRIAVVNFIYTRCTTVCPVTSATFQQLQGRLGATLGRDVVLVSISVDPLRDTPERLHEYASRYQARAGWAWLTGAKPDVDAVLKGLGAYTPSFEDHPAMVLVGDASGWTRLLGFPSVEQLLARVEALRAAHAGEGKVAQHGH
jgi:protein SCO1/2